MIRSIRTAAAGRLKGIALARLDFNTEDEWRLAATVPTVRFLAARADAVIIVSHRGRPDGRNNKKLSLRTDAELMQRLLKRPVTFIPHFRFEEIGRTVRAAARGS